MPPTAQHSFGHVPSNCGKALLAFQITLAVIAPQPRHNERVVLGQTQRVEKQSRDAPVARCHRVIGRFQRRIEGNPHAAQLLTAPPPRSFANRSSVAIRGCSSSVRASRRALRALLSMTYVFGGIKEIRHPEEAARAAVSKDARGRSSPIGGLWKFPGGYERGSGDSPKRWARKAIPLCMSKSRRTRASPAAPSCCRSAGELIWFSSAAANWWPSLGSTRRPVLALSISSVIP